MKTGDAFHVVRSSHHEKVGGRWRTERRGYEVYCNNVPFLAGTSQPLSRREARWVAEKLNAETGRRWVDRSEAA